MKLKDWIKMGMGLAIGKAAFDAVNQLTIPTIKAVNKKLIDYLHPAEKMGTTKPEEENNEEEPIEAI